MPLPDPRNHLLARCDVRRRLHCLIVALLCLNLGVDSARACWHLRRRSQCCPPACATPAHATWTVTDCGGVPAAQTHEPHAWMWGGHVVVTDCARGSVAEANAWAGVMLPAQCCQSAEPAHAIEGGEVVHDGTPIEGVVTENVVGGVEMPHDAPAVTENAVVHSPTIVLGAPGVGAAGLGAAGAASAQPQTARPVAPQPQIASPEPLPELRPATASDDTPRQADKVRPGDQPVPASLDLPEQSTAARQDSTAARPKPADEEMPAPPPRAEMPAVDELAVAPGDDMPREENLFDLFTTDDEESGEPSPPTNEPEMTEERATDGDDAPQPPAKDAPEESDAGAVEATAETPVPDEPLRRWTDATGEHHAQGWLVRIGEEEACILKVSGRHTTMALTDLSADDRDYVAAVAARLAGRPATAAAGDTAGL